MTAPTAPTAPALLSSTHPPPATPAPPAAGGAADQIQLLADPATIADARHHVRDVLAAWHVPADVAEDAVLIVSELATNAVTHGDAATYTVTVTRAAHAIELDVAHRGGTDAVRPRHAGTDDEHGRGLAILAMLATAWGASRHGRCTRTWARLHLPAAAPWTR